MNEGAPPSVPWSPCVYEELRRLAGAVMGRERRDHTLEPTALVHEVWLRLLASRNAPELERSAFLGLAAQAMRSILTEHARRRGSSRRGGDQRRTTLTGKGTHAPPQDFALDMSVALAALEAIDPDLARIVELRFYAGCTVEEIAEALALSVRTVKRRWRFARAWLQNRMSETRA